MAIELKLVITLSVLWTATHFAAYPSTMFSKIGSQIFRGYKNFLQAIAAFYFIPIVIVFLFWLWKL